MSERVPPVVRSGDLIATDHLHRIHENISLLRQSGKVDESVLDDIWCASQALHSVIASGRGKASLAEENVARWTGGKVSLRYDAGHDVVSSSGKKIEVKFSKLNVPNRSRGGTARRWNWTNLLGGSMSRKDYDWLILVGERDERFASEYPPFEGGYIAFAIPRLDIDTQAARLRLSSAARGTIALSTDPKLEQTRAMIAHYAVSQKDLSQI